MTAPGDDMTSQATRYLLDELSEVEKQHFEEQLLIDDGAFDEMLSEEDDLLDAYVQGTLDDPARHAVQQRYLTSSHLRTRLEFAQTLKDFATSKTVSSSQSSSSPARLPLRAHRIFPLAVAAILVVAFAGILFIRNENARKDDDVARRKLVPTQYATPPSPAPATGSEPMIADTSTEHVAPPKPSPAVALLFSAAVTRGQATSVAATLPADAPLRLDVAIDPAETFREYRIEIRTASGQKRYTSSTLEPRQNGDRRFVEATLAPGTLSPGRYELDLAGVVNGQTEDIAYHDFEIRR